MRPSPGGCDFLEDSRLDAREANAVWLPDPDALVALGPAVRDDDDPFSLWGIPGRKSLFHDGTRLLLNSRLGRRVVRLAISLALREGASYANTVPSRRPGPRAAAAELADALAGVPERRRGAAVSRTMLVHMRALQALDADKAGASEREIAALVLGSVDAGGAWNDSAARAQVRYLLEHGRALRDGGYRQLLREDGKGAAR